MRRSVQGKHDGDQHEPETECERQVALGGFQRDGGRHHARHAVDVAADDHHRADLGARAPEPRKNCGEQREANVPEHRERAAQAVDAERSKLLLVLAPGIFDRLPRQCGDDRQHEERLREDHRLRREKEPEFAKRPGARQQQIDEQADHDGRQSHQCIEEDDDALPPRKASDRDRRTERQAEERGQGDRRKAHRET